MIDLYIPPKPAIILAGEPWQTAVARDLTRLGVPFGVRLSLIAELKRLQGCRRVVLRPAVKDLEDFAGLPVGVLASMLLNPYAFASAATITKLDESNVPATNNAVHTHTSVALSATGLTIIGIAISPNGSLGTISSVTANAVEATSVEQAAGTNERSAIFIVNAGASSGNIVITNSLNLFSTTVVTWEMLGGSATKTDSGTDTNSNPATFDLDIAAGGVAVGMLCHRSDTNPTTTTWSNLSEDHDDALGSGVYASAASAAFAAAQTNLTISATRSAAGVRNPVMCCASFPPA